MEHQAHVQADGDVGNLSAKRKAKSTAAGKRPKKPILVSRPAVSDGRRDGPRYRPTIRRAAGRENRRTKREALPAAEHLGGGKLSDERHSALFARARRRTSPSKHVHICEANGASA